MEVGMAVGVGNVLHVVPLGDLIEHDTAGECACIPEPRRTPCADGSDGWLIVHRSLDGREARERGEG
jgi:hypothetical protein